MSFLPAVIVFALILLGGLTSHTASGSPAVLLSVSGGVFLIALFAKHLPIALPLAVASGLVTFALALKHMIPWVGVAEALFLIAWAGASRIRHPIPAALAAGFFGALILAFEIWRGWSGDMLPYELRPLLSIGCALAGFGLLVPGRQQTFVHTHRARPHPKGSKRIPVLRASAALIFAAVLITITILLANPMSALAAQIREALGGASADSEEEITFAGIGSGTSSDAGRPLPDRADVTLSHDFEFLVRAETEDDASHLASRQIYCRTVALDRYEVDRWLPPESNEWFEDAQDGAVDQSVTVDGVPPAPARLIPYTVFVRASEDIILPTLQGIHRFHLPRVISIGDSSFGHPSRLDSPLSYRAESATRLASEIPPGQLRPDAYIPPVLTRIPENETGARIVDLAAEIAPGEPTLPEAIAAVRRYMNEVTTYSTVIENPQSLPPLENFLFSERRGYCEFYATAGALLLRACGFPARVGYGFSGGERTTDPLAFAFFSDDGHAWTEVHVKGYGWCVVDFTPEGEGAVNPPAPAGSDAPAVDTDSFSPLDILDGAPDAGRYSKAETESWVGDLATFATVAGFLFVAGILIVFFRKDPNKPTPSNPSTAPPPRPEPNFYKSFCEAAARVGFPKHPGQTPKEHLAAIAQKDPQKAAQFSELIDYYYAVRYEGLAPDRAKERSHRNAASLLTQTQE